MFEEEDASSELAPLEPPTQEELCCPEESRIPVLLEYTCALD